MCRVDDCDPWAVVTETNVQARIKHQCTECWRTIQPGETYLLVKGIVSGGDKWEQHKICRHCEAAGEVMTVMCNGWPLDDLLFEFNEHWTDGYRSIPFARLIAQMRHRWHDGTDEVPTGCRELAHALMGGGDH